MRSQRRLTVAAVTALALVAVLALAGCSGGGLPASGNVTNQQAQELINDGAVVLDVRTSAEFQGGFIPGARNIPLDVLASSLGPLDKAKPVVIYCATGSRSVTAMQILKDAGFEHVYNLTQGIAAWAQAGLTVTTDTQVAVNGGGSKPSASGLPVMYEFYTDW